MLLLFFLLLFWITFSYAETICKDEAIVPSLESCDRVIVEIENFVYRRGPGKVILGPTAMGERNIRLPKYLFDPQYIAGNPRCAINIIWSPRPGVSPPPTNIDIFSPIKLQQAAYRIRDQCVKATSPGQLSKLGFEWIGPHQWVEVEFTAFFGKAGTAANFTIAESGKGNNQTIEAPMLNQDVSGGSISLENDLGSNITQIS